MPDTAHKTFRDSLRGEPLTGDEFEQAIRRYRSEMVNYAAGRVRRAHAEDVVQRVLMGLSKIDEATGTPKYLEWDGKFTWLTKAIDYEAKRWRRDAARRREVPIPGPHFDDEGEDILDQGEPSRGTEPDIPEPLADYVPEIVDNRDRHEGAKKNLSKDPHTCAFCECGVETRKEMDAKSGRLERRGKLCQGCGISLPYDFPFDVPYHTVRRARFRQTRNRWEDHFVQQLHIRHAWRLVLEAMSDFHDGVRCAILWFGGVEATGKREDVAKAWQETAKEWGVNVKRLGRMLRPYVSKLRVRLKKLMPEGIGDE